MAQKAISGPFFFVLAIGTALPASLTPFIRRQLNVRYRQAPHSGQQEAAGSEQHLRAPTLAAVTLIEQGDRLLHTRKFDTFAVYASRWAARLPVIAVCVSSVTGWASAADAGEPIPVKLAADAPGMIRFDSCTRPAYPEQEAKQNHQGMVTLHFLIGADGKVKESLVVKSSGYPALDDAALAALSKCSFNPPVANGKRVDAWIPVEYDWKPR